MTIRLVIFFSSLLFVACSTPFVPGKTEAESLFNKAKAYEKESSYLLAIDTYNELKTKFSYSTYAKKAEISLADIEFKRKQYLQASVLYRIYLESHPRDKMIPYVLYRIGESYRLQTKKGHDRDLAGVINAIGYYQAVLNNHPESKEAELAEKRLEESKKRLEDKEIYQADFYFKFGKFQSARSRYLGLLKRVERDDVLKRSMKRIVSSSFKLKEYNQCQDYADLYIRQFGLNDWNTQELESLKSSCESHAQRQAALEE